MDNRVEQPIPLIDAAEDELTKLSKTTQQSCENQVQLPDLRNYRVNIQNLQSLLEQLILKLQVDVDKLWISERNSTDKASENTYEDNVTIFLQKRIWGEKESILGCLTKLVMLLDKMVALEQHLGKIQDKDETPEMLPLTEEDQLLIERYFTILMYVLVHSGIRKHALLQILSH